VDPRAGLDDLQKRKFLTLPGLGTPTPQSSTRSQSLYRQRYPGSYVEIVEYNHESILSHFRPEVEIEHFSIHATNCLMPGDMSEYNGLSCTGKR
jgi:hypothetical protein